MEAEAIPDDTFEGEGADANNVKKSFTDMAAEERERAYLSIEEDEFAHLLPLNVIQRKTSENGK